MGGDDIFGVAKPQFFGSFLDSGDEHGRARFDYGAAAVLDEVNGEDGVDTGNLPFQAVAFVGDGFKSNGYFFTSRKSGLILLEIALEGKFFGALTASEQGFSIAVLVETGGWMMKKKLLIGVIVVFGIAAAFFMIMLTTGAAIAAWIYLVYMVRKKKTKIFHDQVEPKLAERRLKRLKAFLLVAAISFAVGIIGTVLHNVLYGVTETEEVISFFIALSALFVFILATGGGLFIYIRGRRKTT